MLKDKQIAKLRETLIASRERILEGAQKAVEFSRNRDRDTVGRDSLDESVEEWMYATELRLKDREKFLLGKVQGALERLAKGTIDECEDCGEEIGFARLAARPVTTLCISCKEERELNER